MWLTCTLTARRTNCHQQKHNTKSVRVTIRPRTNTKAPKRTPEKHNKIPKSGVPEPVQGLRRQLMLRLSKRSLAERQIQPCRAPEGPPRTHGGVSFRLIHSCRVSESVKRQFYLLQALVSNRRPSSPQIQNKQSRSTSMTSNVRGRASSRAS